MPARLAPLLIATAALAACAQTTSGPAPATPSPSPAPTPPPSASTTPLPPGAIQLTVVPDRSLATIRVREQVANVPLPGEAVLTSRAFSGGLVLLSDGSFASGSTISIDLDSLESDSDLRDEWIKINTLDTRRYPRAEFTAIVITGVLLPLPASGEWNAELRGTMWIHGVERELTWPLRVTRSVAEVRAAGMTTFRFGDYGMAVPANRLVLSVVDEVRLEIDVVAKQE
jgi:polyisoprenoid-binding protein YceI